MTYEMIDRYLYAIDEEYDFLSKNKTKILLLEGKELYQEEDGFVYSFKTIKEIGIPDSTPVIVYNNGKSYLGEVLYTESDEIVLYVKGRLNLREKIEFSSAVQELLKALANKIRNIDYNNSLIQFLLNGKNYLTSSALIAKGQDNAIINSTTQPITIIWGPPGTGKTFTLAEIAMKMYASREYSSTRIKEMIKRQEEKYGWEFFFVAANIDAVETAEHIGIRRERAANYDVEEGTTAMYCAMSENISEYRKTGKVRDNWNEEIEATIKVKKKK